VEIVPPIYGWQKNPNDDWTGCRIIDISTPAKVVIAVAYFIAS